MFHLGNNADSKNLVECTKNLEKGGKEIYKSLKSVVSKASTLESCMKKLVKKINKTLKTVPTAISEVAVKSEKEYIQDIKFWEAQRDAWDACYHLYKPNVVQDKLNAAIGEEHTFIYEHIIKLINRVQKDASLAGACDNEVNACRNAITEFESLVKAVPYTAVEVTREDEWSESMKKLLDTLKEAVEYIEKHKLKVSGVGRGM
jgi:ElaB/YqjD/DUF883 family membrane-anchored ribosome-binding protein